MEDTTATEETTQAAPESTVTPADVAAAHEAMKSDQEEPEKATGTKNESPEGEEKTFTQEDVDRIVSERLKRDGSKRESEIEKLSEAHKSEVEKLQSERDATVRELTVRVAVAESGLPADVFDNVSTEDIPGFAEKLSSIVSQRVSEAESAPSGAPNVPRYGTGDSSSGQTRDEIAAEILGL